MIEPGAKLPLDDGTFDVIVSDWTLEHIPSEYVASLVQEFSRVLKPSGWALGPHSECLGLRQRGCEHHSRKIARSDPTACSTWPFGIQCLSQALSA
jgi:ubiquinone/menaquinone biosynthesis C-methylase UbiE